MILCAITLLSVAVGSSLSFGCDGDDVILWGDGVRRCATLGEEARLLGVRSDTDDLFVAAVAGPCGVVGSSLSCRCDVDEDCEVRVVVVVI